MCIVKILICQVITACVPNLSVNHRNLSVVTVIQEHIKSRKQRIEYPAGNSFRFQFSRKTQIDESDRSHVIIEHPDLYTCLHPFLQNRLDPAPCIFILNCMIFHENELLRLRKISKLRLQSFDRFIKINHIRILIHRITRISFYIIGNISRFRIWCIQTLQYFFVLRQKRQKLLINLFVAHPHLPGSAVQTDQKIECHSKNRQCQDQDDPRCLHRGSLISSIYFQNQYDGKYSGHIIYNYCIFIQSLEYSNQEYHFQ